jgi:prolyl-tRNA synthetase
MDAIGAQELLMPALTPKEPWVLTNRWDNFDALFKLNGSDKKEYALGATHEEIVTPLVKKFVFSYRELPIAVYQIQTKFRNEKRAKAGLIRGREFLMKDLYSFHTNQDDLDRYYEKVKNAYFKIYSRLGLGDQTYLTYASGGDFSKYSHEFQTITDAGEDHIFICDKCHVAVNREIIDEQVSCPICGQKELREEKAVEVGNIFKLGTRFSAPNKLKYLDAEGQSHEAIMASYGIGLSRLMGTIVELYHDEKGIIWPESIAPFQVQLLSLGEDEAADKIYEELLKNKIQVLYDDRQVSAGEKFADADLIGCPNRLIVSRKSLAANSVELKKRSESAGKLIPITNLITSLK